MTGVSIVCHVLFFSGVLILPELRFSRPYIPSAVEVDLVSLPRAAVRGARAKPVKSVELPKPPKPAKELEAVKPQQKPLQAEEPKPEKASPKPVSMAPKPMEVKRSLKQKTYSASRVIKSAISKIEKEADKSRPQSVVQAIDKLKEEVESTEGVADKGGAAGSGMDEKTVELLDIYHAEIWDRIRKNWAYSGEMAGGRTDLEATIIVKIMRRGEIRDIWFEKRSGNTYFDDSVYKAVKKSDPLPPLPEGFLGPYHDVGFRFNLSELLRGR
jgi:colicin import membrane protein